MELYRYFCSVGTIQIFLFWHGTIPILFWHLNYTDIFPVLTWNYTDIFVLTWMCNDDSVNLKRILQPHKNNDCLWFLLLNTLFFFWRGRGLRFFDVDWVIRLKYIPIYNTVKNICLVIPSWNRAICGIIWYNTNKIAPLNKRYQLQAASLSDGCTPDRCSNSSLRNEMRHSKLMLKNILSKNQQ